MSGILRPSRLNRFAFLAWGWATLLVIAISAAPDGGAPGSRVIGSAFDPATVLVTVGAQPPRATAGTKTEQAAPLAFSGSAGALALAVLEISADEAATGESMGAHRSSGVGDPRSLTRAHRARAPPLA